jgi:PadR family transcriptional regulator
MDGPLRITINLLKVFHVLLQDPSTERYGLEIGKSAGLAGNGLYPVLMRMERAHLVVSRWEETDPSEAGRPRRRLYRLTSEGAVFARQALQDAQQSFALPWEDTTGREHLPGWGRTSGLPVPGVHRREVASWRGRGHRPASPGGRSQRCRRLQVVR